MGDFLQIIQPYLPLYALHWTTIVHYVLLLLAVVILGSSEGDVPTLFLVVVAAFAAALVANLYINLIPVDRLFQFLIRVAIFGLPMVLAGTSPTGGTRALSVIASILAFPIMVLTFISCMLGALGDPRILAWGC